MLFLWAVMIAIPISTFGFFKVTMRRHLESRPKPVVSQARTYCHLDRGAYEQHVIPSSDTSEELEVGEDDYRHDMEVDYQQDQEFAAPALGGQSSSEDVSEISDEDEPGE